MSRRRWFAKRALGVVAIGGLVLFVLQFYRVSSGSNGPHHPRNWLRSQAVVDELNQFAERVVDRYDTVDEKDAVNGGLGHGASASADVGGPNERHQVVVDQLRQWRYSGRSAKQSNSDSDRQVAAEQQRLSDDVIRAAGVDVAALEAQQLDEEDERDRAVELKYGKAAGIAARKSRFPPSSSTVSPGQSKPVETVPAFDNKPEVRVRFTPAVDHKVTSARIVSNYSGPSLNDSLAKFASAGASSTLRSQVPVVVQQTSKLPSQQLQRQNHSAPQQHQQQQQQQQQRYIPHRCPREMDITDAEYTDWFSKAVVQRSPASYPTSGSTSYSAAAANLYSTFEDEILILTPIANAEKHALRYFQNICSLVYPHRLITLVLGEDSSSDKTPEVVRDLVEQMQPYFRRVELVRLPTGPGASVSSSRRHEPSWQFIRRRHLATVRNRLLMHGLGVAGPSVRWVLWIDSDVRHMPRDLIRHLLSANQSVVVPNCLWKKENGQTDQFDRNTWQETDLSRAELRAMKPDELKLEGYSPSNRRYLTDLKTDGDVVRIDGVGGCVLLVNADIHRSGLVFPPFIFDHHIETEGFAQAVTRYGVRMYGLPSVNVIHW